MAAVKNNSMINELRNAQGEQIDFTYHHGREGAKVIVLIGHGVTGNKDRPFVVALAEGLAKAGIPAVRFSFSGNGASGGKFSASTVSKEVEDLGAVLDAVPDRSVCYVGHSMGGAVGVLRASRDPRIKALVSLAGMVHTKAFAEREFGGVKPGEGFMWDDTNCPLSQTYMDDMAKIGTVLNDAPKIRVPWLLVHGSEDDVVPIQDSHDIFAKANDPKQMVELPGANHVFAGSHTAPMISQVVSWVQALFDLK
ncbi:MAG TPA: alpha/beta fold hydrolase [Verrucomicrobiae bacterium]|nr:alpha/beta fold hydrolase [Verrucomicrobiae bacterium]